MAEMKYKDKNGNWNTLAGSVNIKESISEVYVGSEEPVDPSIKVWYDTSYAPTPLAKCILPSGEWVVVSGGGSDVDYITDEEFEDLMKEMGLDYE